MLATFYVSVHEVRALPAALYLLRELDEEYGRAAGVDVGLLANWLRWKSLVGYLVLARKLGLPVLVDNGGFQGNVDVQAYARFVCLVSRLQVVREYGGVRFLAPDAFKDPERTLRLHERFYSLVEEMCENALSLIVPVLQGNSVEEYARLYDVYLERGWIRPSDYLAVSGLKPHGWRGDPKIREKLPLPRLLAELLARIGRDLEDWHITLHLLGIHGKDIGILNEKGVLQRARFSADSGSQGLNYRFKWRSVLQCKALTIDCYLKSIEREVGLSLKPLLNRPLEAYMHRSEVRL